MSDAAFDVLIVGGGPAGLSAALVLGRARRRVVVFDDGQPRNAASQVLHGFLTRDGIAPRDLRGLARAELQRYPTVQIVDSMVTHAQTQAQGFMLATADARQWRGRKLILATGVIDLLPPIPGLGDLYGRSVFHCPYCDGWELRDQPLAVYGRSDAHGGKFALELRLWSADVVLFTDGAAGLSPECRERLRRYGVSVREERIARLAGQDGQLQAVVLESGELVARHALFLSSGRRLASSLFAQLGCARDVESCRVDEHGRTSVPGVLAIGDASRDVLQAIVAAGEGAQAAVCVNSDLLDEETR